MSITEKRKWMTSFVFRKIKGTVPLVQMKERYCSRRWDPLTEDRTESATAYRELHKQMGHLRVDWVLRL